MAKEIPDVPAVPLSLERGTRELLQSLRQHVRELRGFQGDPSAKAVTVGTAGSIGGGGGSVIVVPGNPGGGETTPDLTPPPMPTGTSVNAGIDFLFYQTAAPVFSEGHGYARTKVYGAKWPAAQVDGPTFADAVLIDEFVGTVGSTPTDPATRWCVWMKWVSKDGIESTDPSGGTNGQTATTGQDVTQLLEALQGKLRNEQLDPASNFRFKANLFTIESISGTPSINPFTVLTVPTMTPAGELLPAGVYMEAAYIKGLEAALARFQTAIITNAMIQNLSATKVTSGVIQVGNYIQSSDYVAGTVGWRLVSGGVCQLPAAFIIGRLTANQINAQGLTITTPDGRVVLDASGTGSAFSWLDVGGRPSDDAIRNNLIDLSFWKRLGGIPWQTNGNEENTLYATSDVGGFGPKGGSDVVWYAREQSNNGEQGGGWDNVATAGINPNKTYRFMVPIRKRDGAGGNAYWGPLWNQVCHLNTTDLNGNPYFANIARDALSSDRWYLFVGFVYPYGSVGNTHDGSGIYDCKTGALVAGGVSFNHSAAGAGGHRAYQYYASPGATQLFGRPMVNVVDGTEPSLREYFESSAVLASAIAYGTNLCANSDQSSAMTMAFGNVSGTIDTGLQWASNLWATDYTLQGGTTKNVTLHQQGNNGSGDAGISCDIYPLGPWDLAHSVPIVPGQKYCFSAYQQSHRCHVGVGLQWFDRLGNFVSELNSGTNPTNWSNADFLANYNRPYVIGVAPANASYARPYMRKYNTIVGYTESWWWGAAPQLEAVGPAATGPGPYSPAPATSTRQLGYSGDLNATNGATIGTNLNGAFTQPTFDVVMGGQALIRGAHIQSLTVGLLSTAWNGGGAGAHIELALNTQRFIRSNGTKSIEMVA